MARRREMTSKWPAEAVERLAKLEYEAHLPGMWETPGCPDVIKEEHRRRARDHLAALAAFLPATQQSGDGLEQALADAIELAQEGWEYASAYFCEKWDSQERIEKLQAVLDTSRASGGGGE